MKEQIYKLNKEQKAIAINLAMKVECGEVHPRKVLQTFDIDQHVAQGIIKFWYDCNDMTRRALQIVVSEKCREHLEKCMNKRARNYPVIEK